MKLSNREKILLGSLGVLVLIVAYYQFVLTPQLSRIKELRTEVEQYTNKVNEIKLEISPQNKIHKEFKDLNSKIALSTDGLFPILIQEKFITIIDKLSKEAEIEAESIAFTEEEIDTVDYGNGSFGSQNYLLEELVVDYNEQSKQQDNKGSKSQVNINKENTEVGQKSEAKLEKMRTTISFTGNYEGFINFVKNIEDYQNNISIKSMSINKGEEGHVTGNIVLDFYAVPKLHQQDDDYFKWDIKNIYGKDNPFKAFNGYTTSNSKSSRYYRRNYDFFMTVKPITSDLPTVIIGKSKDTSMKTYVFAENKGFENVEFQIIKEDDKYYYKYKTQTESYPKNYDDKGIEFKPIRDSIEFYITTYKRNSSNDDTGVNLLVVNKSDLRLNVRIDHEDKKRPRVKIVRKIGDVFIKRSVEE